MDISLSLFLCFVFVFIDCILLCAGDSHTCAAGMTSQLTRHRYLTPYGPCLTLLTRSTSRLSFLLFLLHPHRLPRQLLHRLLHRLHHPLRRPIGFNASAQPIYGSLTAASLSFWLPLHSLIYLHFRIDSFVHPSAVCKTEQDTFPQLNPIENDPSFAIDLWCRY